MKANKIFRCGSRFAVLSLVVPAVMACICGEPAASDETAQPNTAMSFRPMRVSRLFTIPTANVLGSFRADLNAGGTFSAEKERGFLGRAAVGLGDVAEVELSTLSILNSLNSRPSGYPTTAFKMRILGERANRPGLACMLRGTTDWHDLDAVHGSWNYIYYETRLTRLHLIASKTIRATSVHVGLGWVDVRVRGPFGATEGVESHEEQTNLFAPFAGFAVQVNPLTLIMGEIETVPRYEFAANASRHPAVERAWSGVIGVRFFFTDWLATDAGVGYRSDFDGIADASIRAAATIMVPLNRI